MLTGSIAIKLTFALSNTSAAAGTHWMLSVPAYSCALTTAHSAAVFALVFAAWMVLDIDFEHWYE
jgi:hypothetical protein